MPRKTISSCLNVVGLSTTFDAVRQRPFGDADRGIVGGRRDTSPASASRRAAARSSTVSTYGVVAVAAAPDRSRPSSRLGRQRQARPSRARRPSTTRLRSGDHVRASALTSASVMPRQEPLVQLVLVDDARHGLAWRKLRMNSAARSAELLLSFSIDRALERAAAMSRFSRSSSRGGEAEPRHARQPRRRAPASPARRRSSLTAALSVEASAVRTSEPRPAPAPRNGAFGLLRDLGEPRR